MKTRINGFFILFFLYGYKRQNAMDVQGATSEYF
jgi:hypothetical protein